MYKLFAIILIAAVCVGPTLQCTGAIVDTRAAGSGIRNMNPALVDFYGHQIGVPLLAPNVGPWTNLVAATIPDRSYIGQSNTVLARSPFADTLIGKSSLGIVAL